MENNENGIKLLSSILELVDKYGYVKLIITTVIMVFISYATYLTFNPSIMFQKYSAFVEEQHNESCAYRMETSPQIRNYLNNLVAETGADRAFIAEFHNGKSNPSGLQWQYADMNFIDDNADDVRDEYQNVSLVKYPLAYELYKKGIWVGDRNKVSEHDKRLALRLEANDVNYIGASMIYGTNLSEIGFIGVSYTDSVTIDSSKLEKILSKYTSIISPLLDNKKLNK